MYPASMTWSFVWHSFRAQLKPVCMPPPPPPSSGSWHTFCFEVDSTFVFLIKVVYRLGTKPPFNFTVLECFLASRSRGEYWANKNPSSPNLKTAFAQKTSSLILSTCHIAPGALPPSRPQPGIYPRGPDGCWVWDLMQTWNTSQFRLLIRGSL